MKYVLPSVCTAKELAYCSMKPQVSHKLTNEQPKEKKSNLASHHRRHRVAHNARDGLHFRPLDLALRLAGPIGVLWAFKINNTDGGDDHVSALPRLDPAATLGDPALHLQHSVPGSGLSSRGAAEAQGK